MDRIISQKEKRKARRKQLVRIGAGVGVAAGVVGLLTSIMQPAVSRKDVLLATVDRGAIELSVSASGVIVPAFEETVNSPVSSRIMEIYRRGGDSVDVGTPILKLDLQAVETEYKKLLDGEQMRQLQIEQLRATNRNKLSEMAMRLKVSRMELSRKEVELRNERYLDSLGAGTADRVRQAELSYNVGQLQLNEEEQKYVNEQALAEADLKVRALELEIFRKGLAEARRTLEDARIRSPRKAILTYVNSEVGAQVQQGSRVAIVSDLSHFKVEGEIADIYGDRIAVGHRAVVRIGREKFDGTVSDLTPLSRNGVIAFAVQLADDHHPRLRSGLKADVFVMHAIRDDVVRLANGAYYSGKGEYNLFVADGNRLRRRKVVLGESSFEHVEVVGGLNAGDEVVVSDMADYGEREELKINN